MPQQEINQYTVVVRWPMPSKRLEVFLVSENSLENAANAVLCEIGISPTTALLNDYDVVVTRGYTDNRGPLMVYPRPTGE